MTGHFFEDFQVGQKITTVGRTISEADIMNFAGLSGDTNQIHTDAEYSKRTQFGQRVAHGILGLSITSGLAWRTGVLEGTVIAFREIKEWTFIKPIFIGDTIHAVLKVTETKAMPRLEAGLVTIQFDVLNQAGDSVMKGAWTVLVMSKKE